MPVTDGWNWNELGGALLGDVQDVAGIALGEWRKNRCELRDGSAGRAGNDDSVWFSRLSATPARHACRWATTIVLSRQCEVEAGFADDQSDDTRGAEGQQTDEQGKCQTTHAAILQE